MKKNLLAIIFLTLGVMVAAQSPKKVKISGVIKDSTTRQAMPYSTVLVKDSTQKYIASTYASDKGGFELRLPSGNYKLMLGFTGYTPDSIMLKVGREPIDIGTRFLKEGSNWALCRSSARLLRPISIRLVTIRRPTPKRHP